MDCAICLCDLKENNKKKFHIPEIQVDLKIEENQVMRTPCNHYYHVDCLLSVM